MKEIQLTRGQVALVDDEDYESLAAHKWFAHPSKSTFYAVLRSGGHMLRMHRVILSAPVGLDVDHISGNTLDNRRRNLRLATGAQNQCNRGPYKTNKSGFKGVSWHRRAKRWVAQVQVNRRNMYLGLFDSPAAAHEAYCAAAKDLHGEFARFS